MAPSSVKDIHLLFYGLLIEFLAVKMQGGKNVVKMVLFKKKDLPLLEGLFI